MIVIKRSLTYNTATASVDVTIAVHIPQHGKQDWSCAYDIAWPDGVRRGFGYGIDSTQALLLALQAIGTDIYTSDYHRSGRLSWEQPGQGYGFPVPPTIRDLLVGEDARLYG